MSSSAAPAKNDIQQIFKRLRSVQANKVCFDCHSKNPTWASVTYGIFICIDCSGIHRSLGVHLTFVRSTQLDSNWTWQQLRQMQLGGNASATTFFRQHNCVTNDAQQKYKSRAAQLYRDKLHHQAAQAMRLHGTKLFIENTHNSPNDEEEKVDKEEEEDFFEKQEEDARSCLSSGVSSNVGSASSAVSIKNGVNNDDDSGPSVEAALSMSPTAAEKQSTRKSTIGQRKPKKGLGAKKGGLGAQKVKKDFAEIERKAEMADEYRSKMEEENEKKLAASQEEESKAIASARLAYMELSLEQKKNDQKLKSMDPKKAQQVERLGMGIGSSGGPRISHSALTEMNTIKQEDPRSESVFRTERKNDFFDDYEDDFKSISRSKNSSKFDLGKSNYGDDHGFSGFSKNDNSWEKEFEVLKHTSDKNDEWNNNFDEGSKKSTTNNSRSGRDYLSAESDEAQKKFSGAKAISSDMFFDKDQNGGPDANINRFQGSSSISSAEYFNREEVTPGSRYGANLATPDYEDVKESVKQGVSRVAGRLSNMASGVMTQLQDKYGG